MADYLIDTGPNRHASLSRNEQFYIPSLVYGTLIEFVMETDAATAFDAQTSYPG